MDMGILSQIVACLASPECKHVGIELFYKKKNWSCHNARSYVEIACMKKFSGLHKKPKAVEHSTSAKGLSMP